jgi:cell wall hydrolase
LGQTALFDLDCFIKAAPIDVRHLSDHHISRNALANGSEPLTAMRTLFAILLSLVSAMSTTSTPQKSARPHPALNRAEVKETEQRLADLGYWTGPIDGLFDSASQSALITFQKWEGRTATGQPTLEELEAIRRSTSPKPRDQGYEHVEVDLDRQVLLLIDSHDQTRVLPVSTGSGQTFEDEGQTSIAYKPRGRFIVYDKIPGWDRGPLGSLYYPSYISGGVAIHGSRNVPDQPVSHGCIRIPMFAARPVSKLLTLGTIVLVYDKVSFVSGRAWADNPKLKQSASID